MMCWIDFHLFSDDIKKEDIEIKFTISVELNIDKRKTTFGQNDN